MPRTIRTYIHWTTDTETAFVMALRWHGHVGRALAEIGRAHKPAYERRKRSPAFAARWDDAVDQWRRRRADERCAARGLDAADVPMVVGHNDGWTPTRRRAFLRLVGEGETAAAACAAIGLSLSGAQKLRDRDPGFAAAWERALGQSVGVLEQVAVERAVEGVEEEVWHAGRVVGVRRRYSETLLRTLLHREEPSAAARPKTKKALIAAADAAAKAAGGSFLTKEEMNSDDAFATLADKLDKLARGIRRKEAARAERWLAEGLIP